MAYSNKGKKPKGEVKTVAWFMPKKSLIKFAGDEDSIRLTDRVIEVSDFVKYPINEGDTVEVSIKDNEVSFLRKVSSEKAKSSTASASTTTSEANVIDATIYAVSGNKKVAKIILADKDKPESTWYQISESLQAKDYKEIGLIAGTAVGLKIQDDTIVGIKSEEVTDKAESTSISSKSTTSNVGNSIERQASLKYAKGIIKSLIDNNRSEVNDIEKIQTLTKKLTATGLEAINQA